LRYISFNADRCVGCKTCQLVCSAAWQKVFNPLKARLRIEQTHWYGPFRAAVCQQGEDAPCAKVCPTGALYVDEKKKLVQFDIRKCDGCKQCVDACPYDAIFIHPEYPYIFKCDLCGGGKNQLCVRNCPKEALSVKEVGP
jgi:Fe-S-cluster-containing dehydrogenase component